MTAAPSESMEIPEDEKPRTQVERIAAKFGSINKLHKALRRCGAAIAGDDKVRPVLRHRARKLAQMNVSTVYKWNLTGGKVPSHRVDDVNRAARMEGIVLTSEDWSPF